MIDKPPVSSSRVCRLTNQTIIIILMQMFCMVKPMKCNIFGGSYRCGSCPLATPFLVTISIEFWLKFSTCPFLQHRVRTRLRRLCVRCQFYIKFSKFTFLCMRVRVSKIPWSRILLIGDVNFY